MISRYDILERFQRNLIFFGLKNAYLRLLGAKIGKNVSILECRFTTTFKFYNLDIGDNVWMQSGGFFDLASPITIGKNSTLSYQVTILTHQCTGRFNKAIPTKKLPIPVKIGEYTYIGAKATILGGVTIGDHCIIGSNSLVNKDVPSYCRAVGNPIKIKKLKKG